MLGVVRAAVALLVLYLVVILEIGVAVAWTALLVVVPLLLDRLARRGQNVEVSMTNR